MRRLLRHQHVRVDVGVDGVSVLRTQRPAVSEPRPLRPSPPPLLARTTFRFTVPFMPTMQCSLVRCGDAGGSEEGRVNAFDATSRHACTHHQHAVPVAGRVPRPSAVGLDPRNVLHAPEAPAPGLAGDAAHRGPPPPSLRRRAARRTREGAYHLRRSSLAWSRCARERPLMLVPPEPHQMKRKQGSAAMLRTSRPSISSSVQCCLGACMPFRLAPAAARVRRARRWRRRGGAQPLRTGCTPPRAGPCR